MKARKCDRCGDLYESYNLQYDQKTPNGLMPVNLGDDNKYWQNSILDLCPICMKEFTEWYILKGRDLKGELINPIPHENENIPPAE